MSTSSSQEGCSVHSYPLVFKGNFQVPIKTCTGIKYRPNAPLTEACSIQRFCPWKFLPYLPFPPSACLERWSVFLDDVGNVLKFSERNLKENIFVLACSTVVRRLILMTSICCRLK